MRNKEERNAYKCRHYFVYKRGFTLVELVIVIAVIAILAAVLIPTFASVIGKANRASDITNLHNLNEEIMTGEVNGEDIADMKPRTKGWRFKYHVPSRKLVIVDESGIIQESFNGWLNGQNSNTDDFSDLDKLTGPIGGIEGTENPGTGSSGGDSGDDVGGSSGGGSSGEGSGSGSGGSSVSESEGGGSGTGSGGGGSEDDSGDDYGGSSGGSDSEGGSGGSSGGDGEDHSGNEGSGSSTESGDSSGSEGDDSESGSGEHSGNEGSGSGDDVGGSGSGSGTESGSGGSEGSGSSSGGSEGAGDDRDGGSTEKEWWENLDKVTELPDKTTDETKYNDLHQKTELWLNVTSIPEKYFQNNTTLERIHIGDVNRIGNRAFSYCINLKEVIGTAVTIEEKAFEECKALIGFDFNKTKTIEKYAFTGCSSIKTAELPAIERMKDNAFDSLTFEKLVLRPCEIEIGVEGRSEFTPGFTTDELEILPGKWKDSFCIYLYNLIGQQKEKEWSIKVRGAEPDGMKKFPFEGVGENVTIDIDQGSFDNLGGKDAFNGIEVTISDVEKS